MWTMNSKMSIKMEVCPHCGQGRIVNARVLCNDELIAICEECDTVWKQHEKISDVTGRGFWIYAEEKGIEPLWTELEVFEVL